VSIYGIGPYEGIIAEQQVTSVSSKIPIPMVNK
jgi:hypothetical protein